MQNNPCDVFISYRREGGDTLAQLLYDRLTNRGYRVFLDIESLNSGKFNEKLLEVIEECKDIIIMLGGFLFGPFAIIAISLIVSFLEMITISTTGYIGFIMNVLSTTAFACTAAFIYKKGKSIKAALIGLILGTVLMTVLMVLWNSASSSGR